MLFSSFIFLFFFFPFTLLVYFLLPFRFRNVFLLIASLIFYGVGEPGFLYCILLSILWNYGFGLLIGRYDRRLILFAGIAGNLGMLFYYKYLTFFAATLAPIFMKGGMGPWKIPEIMLPLGISFFTFQGMSYLIDVSRDRTLCQKNPLLVALYIALFPQLIAGPIIRWGDIRQELVQRHSTLYDVSGGLKQFLYGLGAKVIIANQVGLAADQVFGVSPGTLSAGAAWLGLAAYTLQIYFDFSGYSNMAIGIGRIFGFHFPVNFRYPYSAVSVTDFWRRWHISLSQWFRDYVYIPLGGNRDGLPRTLCNLMIVFALTGFWHGASWTFIIWGLWHGLWVCLEKAFLLKVPLGFFRRILTLLAVMIGWVFFRCDTAADALQFLRCLAGDGNALLADSAVFNFRNVLFVAAGGILAFPWVQKISGKKYVGEVIAVIILYLCILLLAGSSYNPFLYFRF